MLNKGKQKKSNMQSFFNPTVKPKRHYTKSKKHTSFVNEDQKTLKKQIIQRILSNDSAYYNTNFQHITTINILLHFNSVFSIPLLLPAAITIQQLIDVSKNCFKLHKAKSPCLQSKFIGLQIRNPLKMSENSKINLKQKAFKMLQYIYQSRVLMKSESMIDDICRFEIEIQKGQQKYREVNLWIKYDCEQYVQTNAQQKENFEEVANKGQNQLIQLPRQKLIDQGVNKQRQGNALRRQMKLIRWLQGTQVLSWKIYERTILQKCDRNQSASNQMRIDQEQYTNKAKMISLYAKDGSQYFEFFLVYLSDKYSQIEKYTLFQSIHNLVSEVDFLEDSAIEFMYYLQDKPQQTLVHGNIENQILKSQIKFHNNVLNNPVRIPQIIIIKSKKILLQRPLNNILQYLIVKYSLKSSLNQGNLTQYQHFIKQIIHILRLVLHSFLQMCTVIKKTLCINSLPLLFIFQLITSHQNNISNQQDKQNEYFSIFNLFLIQSKERINYGNYNCKFNLIKLIQLMLQINNQKHNLIQNKHLILQKTFHLNQLLTKTNKQTIKVSQIFNLNNVKQDYIKKQKQFQQKIVFFAYKHVHLQIMNLLKKKFNLKNQRFLVQDLEDKTLQLYHQCMSNKTSFFVKSKLSKDLFLDMEFEKICNEIMKENVNELIKKELKQINKDFFRSNKNDKILVDQVNQEEKVNFIDFVLNVEQKESKAVQRLRRCLLNKIKKGCIQIKGQFSKQKGSKLLMFREDDDIRIYQKQTALKKEIKRGDFSSRQRSQSKKQKY